MGAYYQDSEHKSVNATGQRWLSMSALGQKQTSRHLQPMSALPPKADIPESDWHVRFVPIGDIRALNRDAEVLPKWSLDPT